jgi:hypothetical protein
MTFRKFEDNVYSINIDPMYWRFGSKEGQTKLDYSDLGFVDKCGGEMIEINDIIEGKKITRIWAENNIIFFQVEK